MKLAFVIPAFLPARGFGGPLYHVDAISKIFQEKGHSVTIYTSSIANPSNFSETLPEEEYVDGILVKRYPAVLRISGYWITHSMLADLKRDEYDILHAHLARSFQCDIAAFTSKLRRNPFLITAHGSFGSYLDVDRGVRIRALHIAHNLIAKRVFDAADIVIALNNFEKQQFLRLGVDINKIVIVPNGISLEEFKKRSYDFKAKYGIKDRFVLFVGRLDRVKGVDTLVQAFYLMKRSNLGDVKLVILGEDWGFKKKLLRLCELYNISANVTLIDNPTREDILSALHTSEIFVLPSNYETFSISLLEAFACAKPIVATAVGGTSEIITNGENGVLIRPNHPDELAEAIAFLLRNGDVARKMGLAGERLVKQRFSIDIIARRIERLYNGLRPRM